ncbi:MAG: hypothetical protein HGA45_01035 [Chloroflexales bacterium]|nr:hypothetical protein [Chloroflexales bacterium]
MSATNSLCPKAPAKPMTLRVGAKRHHQQDVVALAEQGAREGAIACRSGACRSGALPLGAIPAWLWLRAADQRHLPTAQPDTAERDE